MNRKARNICRTLPLPDTEPISGSSDAADPPKFFPPGDAAVSPWSLSHLKRDGDEGECKPLDCFEASSERKAISANQPVRSSLPTNLPENKRADASAVCHPTVSSIPASLPHEAVLKSRFSPDLQFRRKLSQNPGSCVSQNLSERRTATRSEDALTMMASGDMKPWDISSIIPVSVPGEALSAKQESEDTVDGNSIFDAVDSHSCSSFTGSTVSYDDSWVVQSLLPAETEDLLESKHRPSSTDEAEIPPSLQNLLGMETIYVLLIFNHLIMQSCIDCNRTDNSKYIKL